MKTLREREDFTFSETLSEMPLELRSEEQIQKELFKGFDPDKMMNAYEAQLGIKTQAPAPPKLRYKHIMLSPGVDDDDSQLLDQLMNDTELYTVANRSQYWTPRGELKIFIEYTENLDVKERREAQKEKEKDNE